MLFLKLHIVRREQVQTIMDLFVPQESQRAYHLNDTLDELFR